METECLGSGGWWEQSGVWLFWHRVAHPECETTAEIFSVLSYLISIAGEHTVLKGPLQLL